MSYGICHIALIPGRAEPSDKSEMVSQILFGEHYTVLEENKKWCLIKIAFDSYECWIDKNQLHEINRKEFDELEVNNFPRCGDTAGAVYKHKDKERTNLTYGAILPWYHQGNIRLYSENYSFEGRLAKTGRENLINNAKKFLNTPYLWGGKSPFGIDCSGLVQVVYACAGVTLPRDAWQQAGAGEQVAFVETARAGDLAFFDNSEGKITHVGLIEEPGRIIHASGKVRIDKMDHQGIYQEENKKYSHNLRMIKRIFD